MPALNRAKCRNVHIYHGASNEILGGMRQNGSITEAVFLKILNDILLVTNEPFKVVQRSSGCTIMPTNNILELGNYDVHSKGK